MQVLNEGQVEYLERCGQWVRLQEDRDAISRWFTDVCPECGEEVWEDDGLHQAIEISDGSIVVLIGCEGYLLINPNAIGMDRPNWQDWTLNPEMS